MNVRLWLKNCFNCWPGLHPEEILDILREHFQDEKQNSKRNGKRDQLVDGW